MYWFFVTLTEFLHSWQKTNMPCHEYFVLATAPRLSLCSNVMLLNNIEYFRMCLECSKRCMSREGVLKYPVSFIESMYQFIIFHRVQ